MIRETLIAATRAAEISGEGKSSPEALAGLLLRELDDESVARVAELLREALATPKLRLVR